MTVNSALDERLDPVAAARAAVAYLTDAYAALNDWPIALTSYNHGVGGMAKAIKKHGTDYERIFSEYAGRSFGFASKNFYSEFLAAREIVRDAEGMFPEGFTPEPAIDLGRITLENRSAPALIAQAYGLPVDNLASLNPGWSDKAVSHGLALPKGTEVWLPRETVETLAAAGELPEIPESGLDVDTIYVVKPGDTLSGIARIFGVSINTLRELNGIPPYSSLIRPGQKLTVGGGVGVSTYKVRRGDTLSDIARSFGMRLSTLRELNGIPAGNSMIHVGQKLKVTGAAGASVHIVEQGDTLTRIASSYRVNLRELLQINRLNLHSLIFPGQIIQIPYH